MATITTISSKEGAVSGLPVLHPVHMAPDPKDMQVPELAVASDILRAKFTAKGDSLSVAALDINERFSGMAGFNKDSLNRAIWAGYRKGLKSVTLALPAFYFLCRFYNIDEGALTKKMGEERLRRWILAKLACQGISADAFLSPLTAILPFAEVATLTGWLAGTGYQGTLNNYYGPLALACKSIGVNTTPGKLRDIVDSVTD